MKSAACEALVANFAERCKRLNPSDVAVFPSEADLLIAANKAPGRVSSHLILLDSTGDSVTSAEFARLIGKIRDEGVQSAMFAIGPADGWSPSAKSSAAACISLGKITLPHELARVVLAEQIYRALTILAGHPYHLGH